MICPKCKAEIDADSCFCDQCGQEIRYCSSCGKPGKGNRCTHCGGKMIAAVDLQQHPEEEKEVAESTVNAALLAGNTIQSSETPIVPSRLILSNNVLGINLEGVDGAVIGRRQGAYQKSFLNFPYVSGTHAQIKYDAISDKWTYIDMNSSNGSKYNGTVLTSGVPCLLADGGILQLANVILNVTIR